MSQAASSNLEICCGEAVGHWVAEKLNTRYHAEDSWAIGLRQGDVIRAGVMFESWNRRSITCHVAIDGIAVTRHFLWAIGDYAFNQCGVEKIIGPVASTNVAALEFDRRLGFVEEGRIANAHPQGDLILLTLTRSQYRFLGEKHERRYCKPPAN